MSRRGRHARPSQTKRNLTRFAATSLTISAPLAVTGTAYASPASAPLEQPAVPVPTPAPAANPAPPAPTDLTVATGDTLSGLAIDTLGLPAWEPFYEENRDVVGDNPDLILPGQVLHYVGGLPLAKAPVVVTEPAPAQEQTAPAEQAAPQQQVAGHAIISNSAGPVTADTQAAADQVFTNVRGAQLITIGGTRASAIDPNGHPSGRALDYMVLDDIALGDAIAQYNIDHWGELHVEYIIWQQRIMTSPGGGWEPMEDRGSPTQNHMDHVHVNYR